MRERNEVERSFRRILSACGLQLAVAGPVLALPLFGILAFPGEAASGPSFFLPAASLLLIGAFLHLRFRGSSLESLKLHEGGISVVLSWGMVSLFSATPLMSVAGLDFSQAVFESVSAWTTTGLSVISVEKASKLVLLYRSTLQLVGGAGIAILFLVVSGGPMGPGLAAAEGRDDRLAPHLVRSARLVVSLYTGYAVVGTLGLWWAGMSGFDALNHSFAAISTGGFSTRAESIGYWDSPSIEAVTMLLMILGSLNFQTAFLLIVRGRFRAFLRNGEVRVAAVLAAVVLPVFFLCVAVPMFGSLTKAFRVSSFEVVSAITTTGFSTTAYSSFSGLGIILLIPLMLIGGATGSTAGGMKQHRAHVALEAIRTELRLAASPRGTVIEPYVHRGEMRLHLGKTMRLQVLVFVILYLVIFFVGSAALVGFGYSVQDSLFEFASALGTVGLSVGPTSPSTPWPALWVMTAGMFLGRLEILIVVVGLGRLLSDLRLTFNGRSGLRDPSSSAFARGSKD